MYKIVYEQCEHFYLCKGEAFPTEVSVGGNRLLVNPVSDYMKSQFSQAIDWRPLIAREVIPSGTATVFFLFWPKATDLDELDERVQLGTHSPADFLDAIATIYQILYCRQADTWWHTLTIPGNGFVLTNDASRVLHNWNKVPILPCPETQESFRTSVVKIFERAADPRPKLQQILLANLRKQIPEQATWYYTTPEDAYRQLRELTGQDFGFNADAWENWLKSNPMK